MKRLIACLLLVATPLCAQTADPAPIAGHDMAGHDMAAMPDAAETPATAAYRAANAQMHGAMDVPYTGDADADFVAALIPHHQGAMDMARIVLQHGTDPAVRIFAQEVIAAQDAEIAWMTAWLEKNRP